MVCRRSVAITGSGALPAAASSRRVTGCSSIAIPAGNARLELGFDQCRSVLKGLRSRNVTVARSSDNEQQSKQQRHEYI